MSDIINIQYLLQAAQYLSLRNLVQEANNRPCFLQIVDEQGVVLLSTNNSQQGSSPTWAFSGLIANQPLETFLYLRVFKIRLVVSSNNCVILDRVVDLDSLNSVTGDISQLQFPPNSIIFDIGDHFLIDSVVENLIGAKQYVLSDAREDANIIFKPHDQSGRRQLLTILNLSTTPKSTRNDKIMKLNQCRHRLKELENLIGATDQSYAASSNVVENSFREMQSQYDTIRKSCSAIDSLVQAKVHTTLNLKFLLEARQVKLLGEVKQLFPISRSDNGEYAIRSLELGNEIMINKDDDHVASALGYIVHMILLVSKYLEIPLRYQLLYMGSRSLIRDAIGNVAGSAFPLFKKGVEKERFEKAINWLKLDIEQLLSSRGVVYDGGQSMLYNLSLLFDSEKCPKLAF